uniref:Uncharacterized protein n=1 Tax=Oryza glumipatula TaxID=40148 RepID=A0A0E0BQX6_9ORYZ
MAFYFYAFAKIPLRTCGHMIANPDEDGEDEIPEGALWSKVEGADEGMKEQMKSLKVLYERPKCVGGRRLRRRQMMSGLGDGQFVAVLAVLLILWSRDTQQCWLGTDDDKDAHELRNDVAPRVKDGARSLPIVPC